MLKEVLYICWLVLQLSIGYHLFFPLFIYLWHKIKGSRKFASVKPGVESDYAIIVTAFEQTSSLPAVVNSILQLQYDNYIIYVVADKCDISQLHFNSEKVVLLRPEEALCSNTRSHFYAIQRFIRPHERLTIIDSDNLVKLDYLVQLDVLFNEGFSAVQGVRSAKNLDSEIARLDAARDIYYHFYDGEVLFNIGSSATLAGSGMAFKTQLYRDCLEHLDITGAGFDKVLQAQILRKDLRIAFAKDAVVYDEKTTRSDQLVNQRSRWINTWFRYFSFGFGILGKGMVRFSINQVLFGLVLLRPPLFIMLGLAFVMMVINIFISPVLAMIWLSGLVCFVLGFALAMFSHPVDNRIIASLKNIPQFIFYQVISLVHAGRANKRSVATQHYHHSEEVKD